MTSESVIERPDDYEVVAPSEDELYSQIEPFSIFTNESIHKNSCLLILNTTIDYLDLPELWRNTEFHICADGGANRLYDYFSQNEERLKYIPQFITGDCDSLRDDVSNYYSKQGTVIIRQETQYATDFMKSIELIVLYHHGKSLRDKLLNELQTIDKHDGLNQLVESIDLTGDQTLIQIYIVGGIGGRFDQTIHSIHQLYKLKEIFPFIRPFFITDSDLIFLIGKGKNYVKYDNRQCFNNENKAPICGLLPFGNKLTINTNGLKYDVHNWETYISGNVSTSNEIVGVNGFTINASDDIVMNVEIRR